MAEPPKLVERIERSASPVLSNFQVTDSQAADSQAIDPGMSKRVAFEQSPSKMTWQDLQKVASQIKQETQKKPASNKKVDVQQFVEKYWDEQNQERTALTQTLAVSGLEESYRNGLEAEQVENTTAASAARDLVTGKDASSSPAIAQAHAQIQKPQPDRSPLQQMYYDILAKQKVVSPELTELASKDLAAGKGAQSSEHIRAAHDKILNRELAKSGLDPHRQNWSQYSRHVIQRDPNQRDQLIAAAAIRGGVSPKSARAMIRWNSPVAAQISQHQGSTAMANYADGVVSRAKTHLATKQMATGKGLASVKHKSSQGVEL